MEALGMIETYGLVPSIEAADAMLKAGRSKTSGKNFRQGWSGYCYSNRRRSSRKGIR